MILSYIQYKWRLARVEIYNFGIDMYDLFRIELCFDGTSTLNYLPLVIGWIFTFLADDLPC